MYLDGKQQGSHLVGTVIYKVLLSSRIHLGEGKAVQCRRFLPSFCSLNKMHKHIRSPLCQRHHKIWILKFKVHFVLGRTADKTTSLPGERWLLFWTFQSYHMIRVCSVVMLCARQRLLSDAGWKVQFQCAFLTLETQTSKPMSIQELFWTCWSRARHQQMELVESILLFLTNAAEKSLNLMFTSTSVGFFCSSYLYSSHSLRCLHINSNTKHNAVMQEVVSNYQQ